MVDVDVQTISVVVAAASVVIGVIFTMLELRSAAKQRRTQLLLGLYATFGTEGLSTATEKIRTRESMNYNDYAEKYGLKELIEVSQVFEGLGFLMGKGLVEREDLASLFSTSESLSTWEKIRPMIEEARKQVGQRKSGEYILQCRWWEYFYDETKRREQTTIELPSVKKPV